MDLKKVFDASLPVISLGTAIIILHFIVQFISVFFREGLLMYAGLALLAVVSLLMLPAFFLLYLYAGYRAGKQGLDGWGAAATAGICYLIAGAIHFILNAVYMFILYGTVFPSGLMKAETTVLLGVMGMASLLVQALYSAMVMMSGLLINFTVGWVGWKLGGGAPASGQHL